MEEARKAREHTFLSRLTKKVEVDNNKAELIAAVREGRIDIVENLYIESQREMTRPNFKLRDLYRIKALFKSALHEAIGSGQLVIAEYLLEHQVECDESELANAARNNDIPMVKLLIAYGNKNWRYGQKGADEGGHLELRRFFSRKIAGINVEL